MIKELNGVYILQTDRTTYAFRVMGNGYLEHLYYGKKINASVGAEALFEKHVFSAGNTCLYDDAKGAITLQDICLEVSSNGKGDMRVPFVEVIHSDGSRTSDFKFVSAKKVSKKADYENLPGAYYGNGAAEGLIVLLRDEQYGLELELSYYVFSECDVITRNTVLYNKSENPVTLEKLASAQLDINDPEWRMSTFNGAWSREMRRVDTKLVQGTHSSGSFTGTSSAISNPFFMLSRVNTDEDRGEAYGFNLIYSGNHEELAEVSEFGKTRVQWGINPRGFTFVIKPDESFCAPEAVMTYSPDGFNGMSQNMHRFVRKHIVRGTWRDKERPILLNSWEAAYFNISEQKLLRLAKVGKSVGIELFVMDDGWFGERNDDSSSLGDWFPNKKKLPNGIMGISEKIEALGMKFGIWVEPEMVCVNSDLYRKHSDWTLEIPEKPHSEGRNQRVLDLSKKAVQEYIIRSMTKVFSAGKVSYVKWDFNRNFTDIFSQGTAAMKQGETAHRYMLGFYRVMKELTEKFPDILFEGCASGGNRFDLGMLCYFPQIWGSDDTDAICRTEIQNGYSYGYPLSTVGAHVSAVPNHQTLRVTPLTTRFNVAAFGLLGYECNLADSEKEDLEEIKHQIEIYKKWRSVFFKGSFYRGRNWNEGDLSVISNTAGNVMEWTVVSEDKKRAVGTIIERNVVPNTKYQYYKAKGLEPYRLYHFYNIPKKLNIMDFGDLVNTVSPVHIKQGGRAHELISRFIRLDGETEDIKLYGDMLMNAGVKLAPGFNGLGHSDKVRVFGDYASRMYFMEETEE